LTHRREPPPGLHDYSPSPLQSGTGRGVAGAHFGGRWSRIQKLTAHGEKGKLVLRPKQEQLLHLLHEHKAMMPREIWDVLGTSKQGALDLLRPLIRAGLVRRIGTKKTGRYVLK
jgi:predicted HTH transcriptional regulator